MGLFELADAVLCKQERMLMLAELSLEPECRRGHGGVYDALKCGQVRVARLPDAEASPQRLFCHCYARGRGNAQMIPGWPYSFVAVLEPGRTSWTLPLERSGSVRLMTPPR